MPPPPPLPSRVPVPPGCEPFARFDRFGEFGHAPIPPLLRVQLALGLALLVPLKTLGALSCLLSYWAFCRLSWLIPSKSRPRALASAGKIACRACLFTLGFFRVQWVQLEPKGNKSDGGAGGPAEGATVSADGTAGGAGATSAAAEPPAEDAPASADGAGEEASRAPRGSNLREVTGPKSAPVPLGCGGVVGNHCSWADILIHMSHSFPAFVARDSTRHIPLIGIIAECMRCVFVDRDRTHRSSNGVAGLVRDRMRATAEGKEAPLLLFPEGTTTNGNYLMRFKTGAFLAGVPVRPVILRYGRASPISPTWETIPAKRHILLMLATFRHSVTCYELPVYHPSEAEQADPAVYAEGVRRAMLDASDLIPSDATFEEKMRYKDELVKAYSVGKKHRGKPRPRRHHGRKVE